MKFMNVTELRQQGIPRVQHTSGRVYGKALCAGEKYAHKVTDVHSICIVMFEIK